MSQSNTQAAGWVLLAPFVRFIVRMGDKTQNRIFEKFELWPKRNHMYSWEQRRCGAEEVSAIKEKSSTSYKGKKKDVLKMYQKSQGTTHHKLSFFRVPGSLLKEGLLGNWLHFTLLSHLFRCCWVKGTRFLQTLVFST